jgi:hypothetical protein
MKVHSTNYTNTLIEIAADCPVTAAEVPPQKGDAKSIANMQFEMLIDHPYKYTSDDVIFTVYAKRKNIPKSEWKEAREQFFSKGQPCMRTSPLTKRYGWGVHSDKDGKIAIYACDSAEYKKLLKDKKIETVKAMRSSR